MNVLLNDIATLGPDANIILLGDFNTYSQSEFAYTLPLANGFTDPWVEDGNPAWASGAFSQDSGTPDDRFDIQFATDNLFDDDTLGWEYVDDSYHPFGNGPAYSGLLATLVDASDHLPVVADYTFIVPEPSALVLVAVGAGTLIARRRRAA